jgi:hypothetical protein
MSRVAYDVISQKPILIGREKKNPCNSPFLLGLHPSDFSVQLADRVARTTISCNSDRRVARPLFSQSLRHIYVNMTQSIRFGGNCDLEELTY